MLELQNDNIYELVIDNSYFIFIGNDSFSEEIDYFRKLSVQQPFSIITDYDSQYSKIGAYYCRLTQSQTKISLLMTF